MAKAALLPLSGRKIIDLLPNGSKNPGDDHLGDPISVPDRERVFSKIDQDNAYLSPVVSIDRPRAIDHANPPLNGQTAPGPHLSLESHWNRN